MERATLGPYAIRAELGRGGMGVVYTAQDPRLDRQVAIKVLPPDLTRDETAKQRFLQEAKAASALDHPNIWCYAVFYSARRATSGSTFVARRAGMEHASSAMLTNMTAAATKVAGSVAVTPKSRLAITRVRATAAGIPMATPSSAKTRPCRTTSVNTSFRVAPRAVRIPSSWVRWATAYEITP